MPNSIDWSVLLVNYMELAVTIQSDKSNSPKFKLWSTDFGSLELGANFFKKI